MPHRWLTDELEAAPLFAAMPKRELRRMARSIETLILGPGVCLQSEGERVHEFFVVSRGEVAVTAGGGCVGYLLPGQWSDAAGLLHGGLSPVGLETATAARVLSLGEREFVACLDTVPGLARRLLVASLAAA
jgi:CRP-like cAMP-binding protein